MQDIVGTWRLVRGSAVDAEGRSLPPPYGGDTAIARVTFGADGRMACVLYDARPTVPDGEERSYTSYCGAYRFDGRRLVTRVDACSDPARMGTDQIRDVGFEDGLMYLIPPPKQENGITIHRKLYWEKLADV